MDVSTKAQLTIIGNTKIYIVPPEPMSKEEFEYRLDALKVAGWAIIQEMLEKSSKPK